MIFAEFDVNTQVWQTNFKFVGREWATASHAFTAAHDLFEHTPDDKGTLEEEMMALGAAIFLRRVIAKPSGRTIANIVAGDIFGHVLKNEKNPKLRPCNYSLGKLPVEYAIDFDDVVLDMNEFWSECPQSLANTAIRWAKYGCIKALERFDNCPRIQYTFQRVHEILKQVVFKHHGKGRFTIAIDPYTEVIDQQWVSATA